MAPRKLYEWPKLRYAAKAVQTSFSGTTQCGLVEVSLDNRIYLLNCFHCDVAFPLCNWQHFVRHMNEEHLTGPATAPTQSSLMPAEDLIIEEQFVAAMSAEDSDIALCREEVKEVDPAIHIEFVSAGNMDAKGELYVTYTEYDDEDVNSSETKANAVVAEAAAQLQKPRKKGSPKTLLTTPQADNNDPSYAHVVTPIDQGPDIIDSTDLDQIVLFEKPYGSDDDDDDDGVNAGNNIADNDDAGNKSTAEVQPSQNCIFFSRTDEAIVHHFLNLLRAYPVLWSWRRRPTFVYDGAIADMAEQLNDRWNVAFRTTAIAESVLRTRYWFKYVIQHLVVNPKKYRTRYKDYFEKCADFLPNADLVQPAKILPCSLCPQLFRDADQLQNHQYRQHNVGPTPTQTKCCFCGLRCATEETRRAHVAAMHQPRPPIFTCTCTQCGKTFFNKNARPSEVEALVCRSCTANPGRGVVDKIVCAKCGKSFFNTKEQQQQPTTTTGDGDGGEFHCKRCIADSRRSAECICDVCGRVFGLPALCKQHRIRHEKPMFNCDLCPKGYHRAFLLKEHKRIHQQIYEFTCEECGRSFLRKKVLQEHIKGVHKRQIVCKICGACYTNNMSVARHLARDHLVLEGTNEELERRLITNKICSVYDAETKSHIYKCDLCDMKFPGKRPFGLVVHLVHKHGYKPIDYEWRKKSRSTVKAPTKAAASAAATAAAAAAAATAAADDCNAAVATMIEAIDGEADFDDVDMDVLEEIVEEVELEHAGSDAVSELH